MAAETYSKTSMDYHEVASLLTDSNMALREYLEKITQRNQNPENLADIIEWIFELYISEGDERDETRFSDFLLDPLSLVTAHNLHDG